MGLMLASGAFALALLAAAAMGLALQRGATCTVAAMEELVNERRAGRLLALAEAAVWVGGGLLLARALGFDVVLPSAPVPGAWTLLGAVLLGVGALVNGACVFGAIARLGTGEWAYLATAPGFFAGCWSVPVLLAGFEPVFGPVPHAAVLAGAADPVANPMLWQLPGWVLWLLVAAAGLRLVLGLMPRLSLQGWNQPWSPHAATAAIGVAFVMLLLLAGAWSYTDVLAELSLRMAAGMHVELVPRLGLAAALLCGALAGGWAAGRWQRCAPTAPALARCFAGGWLLGCGSLLVPGGNDQLVLLGMPLLWPHAWLAFAVMCGVICAALVARRLLARGRRPGPRQAARNRQP